ncbi:VOC family protein [Liquorilactobacillus satsumensis]|uniref:Glyoxalase family protein n=1 Tax=Liquorilactobacillus satsumensis DSM 16230 = JCM 12392 TaxID=1423801 RepID=A0A0R1V2K3_9LACO|nr:VOC family protein [Liquorilactobacillus satsumensis]KRL96949.1 glyoxalase family protein [Liquorilactobacillus satsumensis DSM 16230 = JCM 12392]MCC7667132.1 glyoxalase [Liquorilactobacillus satsumensis]MCP9312457.1 VOC family protein [Liquorilactobacillus satsumensis]MCP9329044.1 VOC family protein [Liquorilactobacillus satsumensis]MCP9357725.1 VOC family protein [Liquorilactobacillus satsumensis]
MVKKMIFVNLPVTEMQRSIKFYKALGFKQNMEFSNEKGTAMMWTDSIWVMLLQHAFYQQFLKGQVIADTKKASGSMTSFNLESIAAVKEFAQRAKENGGDFYHVEMDIPEDQMYELEIKDPDGNLLTVAWMPTPL